VRSSIKACPDLHSSSLEKSVLEHVGRIVKNLSEFLPATKRITCRRGPNPIESSRVNHAHSVRGTLLISNVNQPVAGSTGE
jgi:hypothetical protein